MAFTHWLRRRTAEASIARSSSAPARPVRPVRQIPALESIDLDERIAQAERYLLAEAQAGFPEIPHVMSFPRRAGFRVRSETQTSDVFARAVLAPVLLDIAALTADDRCAQQLQELVHFETLYLASKRLCGVAGGWSYFPDLPELPPDADSLAAMTALFARTAPEHLPLCADPIERVLLSQNGDGSISTWIIAAGDAARAQRRMRRGVRYFWGEDRAVDVCARFFTALRACDSAAHREAIADGTGFVVRQQQSDGAWLGEWYHGSIYPTLLAIDLLTPLATAQASIQRALDMLRSSQLGDGGWGARSTSAQDTALALWMLAQHDRSAHNTAIHAGLERLLALQTDRGLWKASPWIKMDIGRAQGRPLRRLTHGTAMLTTAFCLRTLLLLRNGD